MNLPWILRLLVAAMIFAGGPAYADDGGDGGGGGGGGGGGDGDGGGSGGSDGWRPFENRKRSAKSCSCFFGFCPCGPRKQASKPRPKPVAVAPPPKPKPVAVAPPPKPKPVAVAPPPKAVPVASTPRPRAEVVVAGLDGQTLARLSTLGFTPISNRTSILVGSRVDRLLAPRRLSGTSALSTIRREVPTSRPVLNSNYARMRDRSYRTAGTACGAKCDHFNLADWTPDMGQCAQQIRVGIVDTGVDLDHPSLKAGTVTAHSVRRLDRLPSDVAHGTGVVSLISGQSEETVLGLARSARVFAVDAFHRTAENQSDKADAYDLIAALDWLVANDVHIVNLSLSGEDNELVKTAVDAVVARGTIIVAAAGVPGTAKATGYPARYTGVVAVAGVDGRLRASSLSARGSHIAMTAPATGILVANGSKSLHRVDGTSFAAPFVTAAFVQALVQSQNKASLQAAVEAATKDLGPPGRDDLYGLGIIQFSKLPRCSP